MATNAFMFNATYNLPDRDIGFVIGTKGNKIQAIQRETGATVKLVDAESGGKSTYQIVGPSEGDIKSGKLAVSAPLARALIGKAKGDSVEVATPSGDKYYEILAVSFK